MKENTGKGIYSLDQILSLGKEKRVYPDKSLDTKESNPSLEDSFVEITKKTAKREDEEPEVMTSDVFDIGEFSEAVDQVRKEKEEIIEPVDEVIGDKNPEVSSDVKEWLEGAMTSAPPVLSRMMHEVTNKMVSYIAYVLVQRLTNLNGLVNHLDVLESRIFSEERLKKKRTLASYKDDYRLLSGTFHDMLEFTRKFAIQSTNLIKDPERDEILTLLRSLDSEALKDLKDLIKLKIKKTSVASTLKRDNKE
jgi:hypothetical protein